MPASSPVSNLQGTNAKITSPRWVKTAQWKISISPDRPGLNIRSVTTTHKLRSSPALLPPSQPGNIKQNISNDRRAYHDGTKFASYREWSSKWSHLIMTLMWSSGRRQKEEHLHCDWIIDSVVWNLPLPSTKWLYFCCPWCQRKENSFFFASLGVQGWSQALTHITVLTVTEDIIDWENHGVISTDSL